MFSTMLQRPSELSSDCHRRDYTKNGCHSTSMTSTTTETTFQAKEEYHFHQNGYVQTTNHHQHHSSNEWGDQHDATLLANSMVASATTTNTNQTSDIRHRFPNHQEQMNGSMMVVTNSINVMLDYNKNHHCELPVSPLSLDVSQSTGVNASNGTCPMAPCQKTISNGTTIHQSDLKLNGIPLNHVQSQEVNKCQLQKKAYNKRSKRNEEPPYHIVLMCYLSYVVLTVFGYLRDFMRKAGLEKNLASVECNREVSNS